MVKILIVAFVILSVWANYSHACSCAPISSKEAYKDADVVFSGQVVSVVEMTNDYRMDVRLKLIEGFKGITRQKSITVGTSLDGATCGYEFKIGNRYLVFAKREGQELSTSLCSGNKDLTEEY